jgi:transposase
MARKAVSAPPVVVRRRQRFTEEFRREAVQMMLDGLSAASIAQRLGIRSPNVLYRWKQQILGSGGPIAATLDDRVRHLEVELARVERERDILKKALAIFGRNE